MDQVLGRKKKTLGLISLRGVSALFCRTSSAPLPLLSFDFPSLGSFDESFEDFEEVEPLFFPLGEDFGETAFHAEEIALFEPESEEESWSGSAGELKSWEIK